MSSLYDNIPHEVGLETAKIKKYIYKDQEAKLPIDFVINPVTSVFDKKNYYLQLLGTAMGTPLSTNYVLT